MPALLIIPFVVFFACAVAQFYFLRRVRAALAERHPDVWREISIKAWFIDGAVSKFVWRGAKESHDSDLTAKINHLRILYAVGLAAWLAYGAASISGVGLATR